jgi:hypothetical protein
LHNVQGFDACLRSKIRVGILLKAMVQATPAEACAKGNEVMGHKSNDATRVGPSEYAKALIDSGISKQSAHRYQAQAAVPPDVLVLRRSTK